MKYAVFPGPAAARKARQSMALIITLAILSILSILLVSFVSMALLDRGATSSYTQSLPADQIAQGGLDQIVSQLQAEIADSTLSTDSYSVVSGSSNNLYVPLAPAYAVPQRTAPPAGNMATLLSYSGTNLYTRGAGTPDYSSACLTQSSSLNGRSVTTAVWNQPQLTTSTSGFPSPKWILMTRAGPQAFSSYTSSVANAALNNSSYVVGRFAYIVYDTSGLLDANVAGYPSGAAANASGKGLLPWADLTQLGITQASVNALVNWRNATTATPAANYAGNVLGAATNNGYMSVANGDTCFLGRQELIKYAATQAPDTTLTSALPYLTTFSREINGPTWGPTINATGAAYQYASQQYTYESFNPRIPNPRVQATFTRDNGLTAVPGEPLVKYRFPLDKLALLEKFTGQASASSAGSLTPADITNIQKYFGLDLATNTTPYPNGPSYRHWNYPTQNPLYVHNAGTSGATGVMSLDDVAALPTNGSPGREPDFFELLQAGILSGSLGAPGSTTSGSTILPNAGRYDKYPAVATGVGPQPASSPPGGYLDPDDSKTLQIMRIGANIIDQWGAENFPTTITYTPSGGKGINVEGIKDLPYPCAAYFNIYAPTSQPIGAGPNTTPVAPFDFYLYFELWNPHQTPSSPVAANYPTAFRFYPFYNSTENPGPSGQTTCCDSFVAGFANGGTPSGSGSWFYNGTQFTPNGSNGTHTYYLMINSATNSSGTITGIPFSYSPTGTATDFREPAIPAGTPVGAPLASVPAPWNGIACLVLPPLTSFPYPNKVSNNDGHIGFPSPAYGPSGPTSAWECQYDLRMVMPVQYQDASGNWHTYSTFLGIDDQNGAYPLGTYYEATAAYGWNSVSTNAALSSPVLMKSDPRTFRFGLGQNSSGITPDYNLPLANSSGMPGVVTMPPDTTAPFKLASGTTYRFDLWAENDSTNTSGYNDVDGVRRWGDAHNSYTLSTPTSPLFTGDAANRPVILNRPFQSVGEMGYAFRDMPWKSLDLDSANSADSALLDLFTLNDPPVLAGRVNPNTPYPQVLAALISGATQSTVNSTTVSSTSAQSIGQAIQNTTAVSPFVTRADIVNNFMTNSAITSMSAIKTEEEAAVRAVAESANTRTWTFLIDVIAQSGRYPTSASSLDNFVVEGQHRYWLHVSIDRYTGQVVDKQLEVVNE